MAAPNADLRRQVQQHRGRVRGLQAAVYSQPDPSANPDLYRQLAQEEKELHALDQQLAAALAAESQEPAAAPRGRLLGPETTGLRVTPTVNMHPLPTGIYHLLDPDTDPLLTVTVANVSADRQPRRVCVKAFIEGLCQLSLPTEPFLSFRLAT
jgi:hypothetical protein